MTEDKRNTHPLITRRLGRTNRQVTTFGLGGQASIQWTPEGTDPIAIIAKAFDLGVTYYDTSNVYGPSQQNFGEAFRRLGLTPGTPGYDPKKRERIFLASKTHVRTARRPPGERFRTDFSQGMMDDFKVKTAVDDVRRSLSLMFGDGKGGYPEGAYLDCIQMHNLNTADEVDMLYLGLDDPTPEAPWMGALAAMLDLREGTDRTGCNPRRERLVRHIGITGHWSTAVHMLAIQRDERRLLDTLLVAINANDRDHLAHQYNAIPVAAAADMGVIGMKVFADGAYFHKESRFSHSPEDLWLGVGSDTVSTDALVQYPLSVPGVATVIIGIGHVDDAAERCQLTQNVRAAQLALPLPPERLRDIEQSMSSEQHRKANGYFQLPAVGLGAPRNVGAEADVSAPMLGRRAARLSWDTAYAGAHPIERYDVVRGGEVVGTVPHRAQWSRERFTFDHVLDASGAPEERRYQVTAVDAEGVRAASAEVTAIV